MRFAVSTYLLFILFLWSSVASNRMTVILIIVKGFILREVISDVINEKIQFLICFY